MRYRAGTTTGYQSFPIVYVPSSVGVVDDEEYRTPARILSLIAGGRAHVTGPRASVRRGRPVSVPRPDGGTECTMARRVAAPDLCYPVFRSPLPGLLTCRGFSENYGRPRHSGPRLMPRPCPDTRRKKRGDSLAEDRGACALATKEPREWSSAPDSLCPETAASQVRRSGRGTAGDGWMHECALARSRARSCSTGRSVVETARTRSTVMLSCGG